MCTYSYLCLFHLRNAWTDLDLHTSKRRYIGTEGNVICIGCTYEVLYSIWYVIALENQSSISSHSKNETSINSSQFGVTRNLPRLSENAYRLSTVYLQTPYNWTRVWRGIENCHPSYFHVLSCSSVVLIAAWTCWSQNEDWRHVPEFSQENW